MLHAHYHNATTYTYIIGTSQPWLAVLDWIRENGRSASLGEHEIQGRDMYAIVSEAETKGPKNCRFEAHQEYIDLHYVVAGSEEIACQPVGLLTPTTEYDQGGDVTLFETAHEYPNATRLVMLPDTFAIFTPGDAHAPLIRLGVNIHVRKVVVKIRESLVPTRT